ncbi:hypothetical protein BD289DRAFT_374606 [Coniella lustricola]|uniref:Uncharacterized protein n=1 Tax=Coniella lustricola TaxID=2025994 RepID=A0A2T2ZZK2_9PEZI|nr:hypothetical protein BD289DRAFT_374606 [Coniella lustricola]
MTDNLPIALRRPRRRATQKEPAETHSLSMPATPRRDKKRVRFSEPGLAGEAIPDNDCSSPSTGLTPFMRRAKLSGSADGRKRRRHSGPAALTVTHALLLKSDEGCKNEVAFLPLRQVVDGRVHRRLRRDGLSDEMHHVGADTKRKISMFESEIEELRAALAARDAEIRRLSDATSSSGNTPQDIHSLRTQVELLRHVLQEVLPPTLRYDNGPIDYSDVNGVECGQDSVSFRDRIMVDVEAGNDLGHIFDDSTMFRPACSTPKQRQADLRHSFPTPPSTSPVMGMVSPPRREVSTTTSHVAEHLQVDQNVHENSEAEDDTASLYLEIEKLTSTVEGYEAMTSRLAHKMAPIAPENGSAADAILESRSPSVKVEVQLNRLIDAFRERKAALAKMTDRLGDLGFRGNDAPEMLASLRAAFREARLELEYFEPGESTLPLTASGAAVLDLLLTRLRALARERLEQQEKHNAVAVSLRRQLAVHVEDVDALREEIGTLKGKVKLRNVRIQELETGMDKLKMTVKTYTRDIAELEKLAQKLECDLAAANTELQRANEDHNDEQKEQSEALQDQNATILSLEERLRCAADQAAALRTRHEEELATIQHQHPSTTALKDNPTAGLGLEIAERNRASGRAQAPAPQVVETRVTRRSARY